MATPDSVASVHSELVASTRNQIADDKPYTAEALNFAVDILLKAGVITERDGQFLRSLIDTVVTSENLDRLADAVRARLSAAQSELTLLAEYVGVIVLSSVNSARELLQNVDWPVVREVILKDARGTLDGALMGYRLYGAPGAAVGAAIGGGATSMPAFAAVPAA